MQMKVSNPLTVIAIFAGIAETSATAVLWQLTGVVQLIFVWYVMLFPVLLVSLFFFVLYKNNRKLYAPSDYEDQKDFMVANALSLDQASFEIATLQSELSREEEAQTNVDIEDVSLKLSKIKELVANATIKNKYALPSETVAHYLAENADPNVLSSEFLFKFRNRKNVIDVLDNAGEPLTTLNVAELAGLNEDETLEILVSLQRAGYIKHMSKKGVGYWVPK